MLAAIATATVSLELIYGLVLVTGLAASFEFPARQSILPASCRAGCSRAR